MGWLKNIFKLEAIRDDISSTLAEFPKLPNATALKEKFEAERNAQKENSWTKIRALIENAMKEGKGYVEINSDTYKNIPLRELSHEIKNAEYKLRDNTFGLCVGYCYNMGYSLIILLGVIIWQNMM